VVAVVNSHAILSGDLDDEIRLSVLDPSENASEKMTAAKALDELISRTLIEQQMRQEGDRAAAPTAAEVDARLAEIRRDLPACAGRNCASDDGWGAFLAEHALTPARVARYIRSQIEILRFIELRFRQGIRVAPGDVETYYHNTLLPQYAAGAQIPALEQVAPRIEEVLLERQVSALFDDWLKNLRRQGEIEVLDPALETMGAPGGSGEGSE